MESKYKNKNSIVLENARLRAEFVPDPGGKMVSLINKETGYEFLVQRGGVNYRDQPFDGVYVEGECSGFDDMFPTIDTCYYETEPWKGIKMADHGEVWSLPWKCESAEDCLHLSVQGVRFPYELSKRIYFGNPNTLRLEYTLTNTSAFEFGFLWAGHLMLNMVEGTRLSVPHDCRQAITILTNGRGSFGDLHNWPWFEDKEGNAYRADISRPPAVKGFEKYYFINKLEDGFCELCYPDNKNKLKVSFPFDTVPYLGILMNENGWDNLYNIFIEPCTVCYDSPITAKKYGQLSKVNAFATYCWYLQLTI